MLDKASSTNLDEISFTATASPKEKRRVSVDIGIQTMQESPVKEDHVPLSSSSICHHTGSDSLLECKIQRQRMNTREVRRDASRIDDTVPALRMVSTGSNTDRMVSTGSNTDSSYFHDKLMRRSGRETVLLYKNCNNCFFIVVQLRK